MKLSFAIVPATGAPFEFTEDSISWLIGVIPDQGGMRANQLSCHAEEFTLSLDSAGLDTNAIKVFVLDFGDVEIQEMSESSLYLFIELNNKRWMDPELLRADTVGSDARFSKFYEEHQPLLKAILKSIKDGFLNCSIDGIEDPFIPLMSGDMIIELPQTQNKSVADLISSRLEDKPLLELEIPSRTMH